MIYGFPTRVPEINKPEELNFSYTEWSKVVCIRTLSKDYFTIVNHM